MNRLLKVLLNICLLRCGPEELPHSYVVSGFMIAINLVISIVIGSISHGVKIASLSSIAGLFFSLAFTKIVLLNKPQRFLQTFTAMAGVDAVISIVSLPSFYSLAYFELGEMAQIFFSGTVFALFVWTVIVYGYIFSKALSSMMSYGVAISVGYALLMIIILDLLVVAILPT